MSEKKILDEIMKNQGYHDAVASGETRLKLVHLENHYSQMRIEYILTHESDAVKTLYNYYLKRRKTDMQNYKEVESFITEKSYKIIHAERKNKETGANGRTALEICFAFLDREIVKEQLLAKGYDDDTATFILDTLKNKYSYNESRLFSCDLDDYSINGASVPTLKSIDDRFSQLLSREMEDLGINVEEMKGPTR